MCLFPTCFSFSFWFSMRSPKSLITRIMMLDRNLTIMRCSDQLPRWTAEYRERQSSRAPRHHERALPSQIARTSRVQPPTFRRSCRRQNARAGASQTQGLRRSYSSGCQAHRTSAVKFARKLRFWGEHFEMGYRSLRRWYNRERTVQNYGSRSPVDVMIRKGE